jgi:poly-gamma-glutamate capsule biosynthesis protein CapA/YwtB (metallophosphatase superfamily)/predicted metalloprotease with PDZ domain
MTFRLGVVLAAIVSLGTTAALAQDAPLLTVLIKPGVMNEAVGRGDLDVTMTIPGMDVAAGAPFLSMGMFVPGLARAQELGRLDVLDDAGPVPLADGNEGGAPGRWVSQRAVRGDVVVSYRLIAENIPAIAGGPPIGVRIDGDGFSASGRAMLMAPSVTDEYRIALTWDLSAMGPGAEAVSSYGDGDLTLPAGPVDRLGSAFYMAGHLKREPRSGTGAFSAVWVGEPAFDPRPAMQWTSDLHAAMSRHFNDVTEPPYRVFLRYNPMNAGGGAALTNSFIVTYGTGVTGENLKSILGHEMTHTWTANGIGRWYSEGTAVFYQTLLPWRAGLMTADQYLADLNRTASRYYTNALRDTPESEVEPRFWEETRIRVLPYDRGAMYFAVLNGKVRRASGGARSIDDLIQAMITQVRDSLPVSETVWLDLLRSEIGEDGPAVHRSMLAGGLMLPESDDFGPCFRRTTRPIRQFDLGFDNESILGAEKIVQGLTPGSEAENAGLRNGDRITYAVAIDAVQRDVTRTLDLQVTRDGETFPLTYLPRGEPVDAYQWERDPAAPAGACTDAATPASAQQLPRRPSNEPEDFLKDPPEPASLKGAFSLVTIGDLLYSHPMVGHPAPDFQKVVEIVRAGDVAIGNQEGVFFDLETFTGEGYGNGLLWGEGSLAEDMKALGVDMVSVANNHSTDWGPEGLIETRRLLDAAGVVHSGGGRTLQEARAAGILDTPKGRVALVSAASTFKPNAGANDAFVDVPARPGISTLRLKTINLVTPDQLAAIRRLATERAGPRAPAPAPDATEVVFGGEIYRLSDRTGVSYDMDLYDHAALLKSVREAKAASDLTVFTIHAHESPTGMDDDTPAPPDFLIRLFHDCVDAGADVIVGGGPHSLRGVEIYKGKPIFYGMGVFFIKGEIKALQETAFRVFPDSTGHAPPPPPAERSVRRGGNPASWYDGVVAVTDFEDGRATTVRLYPLDVGNTYDPERRGNPHLADPEVAQRILSNLQRDSAAFGTVIEIEGSVGVIRIP